MRAVRGNGVPAAAIHGIERHRDDDVDARGKVAAEQARNAAVSAPLFNIVHSNQEEISWQSVFESPYF